MFKLSIPLLYMTIIIFTFFNRTLCLNIIFHHDYQFILLFCLLSFKLRSDLEYKKLDFLCSVFLPFNCNNILFLPTSNMWPTICHFSQQIRHFSKVVRFNCVISLFVPSIQFGEVQLLTSKLVCVICYLLRSTNESESFCAIQWQCSYNTFGDIRD